MLGYLLDGHNLSPLFDTSVKPVSFAEDPAKHVPNKGSIIYSVWDGKDNFLYIGISGLQRSLDKRSPLFRMVSHASGRRSGDQFCVYIHDFFVVPSLINEGTYTPKKGALDRLTRDYIRKNLSYRFLSFQTANSDKIVRDLEEKIRRGELGIKPMLNSREPWVQDD